MAAKKVHIDSDCFYAALKLRGSSIRKLGAVDGGIGCDEKTIRRGLKDKQVSRDIMERIARGLNVDPDYLSGRYHDAARKCADERLREIWQRQLTPDRYPYLFAQQRDRSDGHYLYDRYLENILVIHNIDKQQFDDLSFERQKEMQVELENAICQVLLRYFNKDAAGRDTYPEIYHLQSDIEEHDPNFVEPPEGFFDEIYEAEDPFAEKYRLKRKNSES